MHNNFPFVVMEYILSESEMRGRVVARIGQLLKKGPFLVFEVLGSALILGYDFLE